MGLLLSPHPSGTPILSLDRDHVDISFLTKGEHLDLTQLRQQAEMITGHTSKDFDRAKKFHEKDPNDADFLDLYRGALEKKVTYLSVLEKYLWAAAGISGDTFTESTEMTIDPTLIPAIVTAQIEHVRDNVIPTFVKERSGLLALGNESNPLLLLTHDGANTQNLQAVSAEVLGTVKIAQDRFETLSEAIKQNAIERGKTLEELLDLSPLEIVHSVDAEKVSIYLVNDTTDSNSLEAGKIVGIAKYDSGKMDIEAVQREMTATDVRKLPADETIGMVLLNRHIGEPIMDFGYAYKRVQKSFGKDVELTATTSGKDAVRPSRVRNSQPSAVSPEV